VLVDLPPPGCSFEADEDRPERVRAAPDGELTIDLDAVPEVASRLIPKDSPCFAFV